MKLPYFFIFVFSFLVFGCSGFDFVYEKNIENNKLDNNTIFNISGDDDIIIKIEMKNLITESNQGEESYLININSTKTVKNLVVEDNQVASQIEISHDIEYALFNTLESCSVSNKKIKTTSEYNAKSSGYDYGSDSSKGEIITQNIKSNIRQYLQYISSLENFKC